MCGAEAEAETDLFEAGLSSLTSAKLRAALQKATGLELDARLLFELPTVGALAAALFGASPLATYCLKSSFTRAAHACAAALAAGEPASPFAASALRTRMNNNEK